MDELKKRLLIVDDETGLTWLMKLNLERMGRFVVKIVNESSRVYAVVRDYDPHLILLDLGMPDMSGDEVLMGLEADPRLNAIPVVIFSAYDGPDRKGIPRIPKPVSLDRLICAIDTILVS